MIVDNATATDDAITDMFLTNFVLSRALFHCGEYCSFMSTVFYTKLNMPFPEPLSVEVGDGRTVPVTTYVSGATIDKKGSLFPMTCLVMLIPSFEIVLGMDWLSDHKASIKCHKKIKSLTKECDSFLAYVLDVKKEKKVMSDIPIVSEYPKVFLDDLPGLASIREVEYKIDLVSGATLVAKALYRLAPSKIREMISQIQELLDRGFILPIYSPWDALVLFMQKKDGTL
ncbi:uncharacterized protein [Rutidosis leptorrhynchoides]|uniref:uncharacterized protein n=1 Tax=Rutidosis leptorrhynchoides TaxID=125765 RepID=UPI003A999596